MDDKTREYLHLLEIGDNSGAVKLANKYPWVERQGNGSDNPGWEQSMME